MASAYIMSEVYARVFVYMTIGVLRSFLNAPDFWRAAGDHLIRKIPYIRYNTYKGIWGYGGLGCLDILF